MSENRKRDPITASLKSLPSSLVIISLSAFLFAAGPVVELKGTVVHISDGDTIRILVGSEAITIRLEGIDAPESGQAFGTKSTHALRDLVDQKEVVVRKTGDDRYKRTLGFVFAGDVNVNAKLVEDGWAWHYKEYNNDPELAKLEVAARKAHRGLWVDQNALAPWEFRQRFLNNNPDRDPPPRWLQSRSFGGTMARCFPATESRLRLSTISS